MSWVLQEREVSCFSCQRKRRSWFLCPLNSIIRLITASCQRGFVSFLLCASKWIHWRDEIVESYHGKGKAWA